MGGARDRPIRVHLLPSSPDANGEPWRAFFGVGHKAVQIGSAPFIPETLDLDSYLWFLSDEAVGDEPG